MKLFKKPMTWGGYLGLCGICFALIAGAVGYVFGVHKIIGKKCKEIKDKIFG